MSRYQHGVRQAHMVNSVRAGRGPSLLTGLLSSAAIAALALIPDAARAQSFTWAGATSDYNTATNWTPNTVPASSGQSAIFDATGSNTVNVSAPVSPDSWTFNSTSQSYTFTGSAVTFGTTTGIQDSSVNQLISIANNLGGTGGITINGSLTTMRLSGNNTYSGATDIAVGTLQAGSTTALSSNSAYTVDGGIDLHGFNNSIGSLSGTAGTAIISSSTTAAVLTTITSGTTVYAGRLLDGGGGLGLTVDGTGTLVLTGNSNTYTGATTINSNATLQLGNNTPDGNLQGTTLVTDNGTLAFDFNTANGAHSFSNNINGTGGVTISGTGTVVLAPTAFNTYSGATVIDSGATLQAGSVNAFGNGAPSTDFTVNGTFDLNGFSVGAKSLTGAGTGTITTTNGNATLTVGTSGTTTFSGNLQDGGAASKLGLTLTGNGTQILSGNNSYSGATTINSGATLQAGSTTAFSAGSDYTVNGTLDLNGSSNSIGSLAGAGTVTNTGNADAVLTVGDSSSTTFSGTLQDGTHKLGLTVSGTGTLTLIGANTYTGATTVNSGATLQAGNTSAFSASSDFTVNGTLDLRGFNSSINSLSGAGTITNNGGADTTLTVGTSGTHTFSGILQDGSTNKLALTATGNGTLVLTGANTYTGGTTINSGVDVQVGAGGTAGAITGNVTDNGVLAFNRSDSISFGGNITGSGQVTIGGGTVTLTGSNNYNSFTNIEGGTLAISGDGNIGTGDVIMIGGTLRANGTFTSLHNYQLLAGNGGTFDTNGNTLTLQGVMEDYTGGGGSGNLTKIGAGTLILTGANTYTGTTTISGGTLQIGNGGATGTIANTSSITDNGVLAFDHSDNISGVLISGSGSLVQMGSGVLTVAGSYTGGTTISAGTIAINSSGALGTGAVTDNATLAINSTGFPTIANAISGSGVVQISGSGTATLSGANSYSGGTTIASGAALEIGGASGSLGSGAVTDNGTLLFSLSNNATVANVISGGGSVSQSSLMTLILTGANSYTGSTLIGSGTVQVGNGGASGSLGAGSITDGGTLAYDLSVPVSLSTAITGSGGLTQMGSGTLTISTAQNYSGATVINSGTTLALGGAGSIASSGGVADNGTFDISGITAAGTTIAALTGSGTVNLGSKQLTITPGTGTFSGSITGTGALIKQAFSTLILTGANTYTGGTTIAGGTLQIGNGGTTGSIIGAVTDNGTLAFNRSDSITVANVISGAGNLTQAGSGTVILTEANTYSGITAINNGATLQVGGGGTSGSLGTGIITDNGTLAFSRSDSVTYANVISGTGGLTQAGSGTLILDGANTYTGTTTVSNGILEIGDAANPGASVGGSVNVQSGATLYGHGTVKGNVTIASGGTLRPGGTIGTLTVNGNLSLPAGSTLVAEVSPSAADRVNVGGAATLGGNLQIVADAGSYAPGTDFRLISAASVSGTFASVSGQVPGLTNTLQYSATGVDLILNQAAPTTFLFGTYGAAPNQTAAGNALAASSPTGALYTAMGALVGSSTASVPGALSALSGDIRPSLRAAAIEDSRMIRNTLLDHMDQTGAGMTVWGAGFAGYGGLAGNGNAASLHHDNAGFLAGIDMPVMPDVTLGADAGYSSNSAHTPGRISAASGDSGHVGAYASFHPGDLRFAIGGDYGFGTVTINRAVPALGLSTTDSQDQQTGQVFADLGYHIGLDGIALEPHAGIAHIAATGGAFAETGSVAALSGGEKSDSETYSLLGLRAGLSEMVLDDDLTLTPRFDLGWQHALARLTPYQTVSYVSAGTSFTVLGTPLAQDAAALEAGFDLKLAPSASLFITYDGSFSSTVENHAFRGGLSWQF